MYDNFFPKDKYSGLKSRVFAILNGDDTETDAEEFAEYIHRCYESDEISAQQYDDLMRNLSEMLL
jgi:hypothetical protein